MENYNGMELVNGVLFIKSLASQKSIEQAALSSVQYAFRKNVLCEDALLDDTTSKDIDRNCIYDLFDYLETGKYRVLVVNDIFDITTHGADLKSFINRVNDMGIAVLDLSLDAFVSCNNNEEC